MKRILAVGTVGPQWGGATLSAEGYSTASEVGGDQESRAIAMDSLFGEALVAREEF